MYCWGHPHGSKTWHVFHEGMSLCRRWGFFRADEPVAAAEPVAPRKDDCKTCVKLVNRAFGFPDAKGDKT